MTHSNKNTIKTATVTTNQMIELSLVNVLEITMILMVLSVVNTVVCTDADSSSVGVFVGSLVDGPCVGLLLGNCDGFAVGNTVGCKLGLAEGFIDGDAVGLRLGVAVGSLLGRVGFI